MQQLNCLIIEDEPLAAAVLQDYINDLPNLKLIAVCRDALTAMQYLREQRIELLFVDIHLPKLNGIDFVKALNGNYHIILTTAYHQYALDGFNLNVVDYLLKPIEFSRFLQAIHKVFEKSHLTQIIDNELKEKGRGFHFFNVNRKQVKIFDDEILYIESLKDYVRIHCKEKRIVTHLQLAEVEKLLVAEKFVRVHKSFLVNWDNISAYNSENIDIGTETIPIGRTYKDSILKSKS